MLRKLLIGVIKIYQRFLSPYKGFRCAYSVYHHTHSCSVAVIDILQQNQKVTLGIQQIRERLLACKAANVSLQELKEKELEHKKKPDKKNNSCSCADSVQFLDCGGNSCNVIDSSCFDGCSGCDSCSW